MIHPIPTLFIHLPALHTDKIKPIRRKRKAMTLEIELKMLQNIRLKNEAQLQ